MAVLRTWRCTRGHVALTVLEPDDARTEYPNPPCPVDGCTCPTAERRPTEGDQ